MAEPRLVVIIGNRGVELIRMVYQKPGEENGAIALYGRAKDYLSQLDNGLKQEGKGKRFLEG